LESVIADSDVLDDSEKALAFFRRGLAYTKRGQEGDVERAIADYTAVIEMPDASAEQKTKARKLLAELRD